MNTIHIWHVSLEQHKLCNDNNKKLAGLKTKLVRNDEDNFYKKTTGKFIPNTRHTIHKYQYNKVETTYQNVQLLHKNNDKNNGGHYRWLLFAERLRRQASVEYGGIIKIGANWEQQYYQQGCQCIRYQIPTYMLKFPTSSLTSKIKQNSIEVSWYLFFYYLIHFRILSFSGFQNRVIEHLLRKKMKLQNIITMYVLHIFFNVIG